MIIARNKALVDPFTAGKDLGLHAEHLPVIASVPVQPNYETLA